jgi:glucokinase
MFDRTSSPQVFDDVPYGGEIGHVVVDTAPDAPLCDCGRPGHLGAVASGRGVERLARRLASTQREEFAGSLCSRRFGATPGGLTNEHHIVPAARLGDRWTWSVIRTAMRPLAQMLAAVVHAAGCEKVAVMGGFASQLGPRYASELQDAMQTYCSGPEFGVPCETLVYMSPRDDEPCLRGAARYARTARLVTP